ncbi:MAG: DUF1566 domain-containing protein [Deltaproteobacteria bacterium]|nr:DUF1566 domain-containing protein [Deltaproteobacteria bacterium]
MLLRLKTCVFLLIVSTTFTVGAHGPRFERTMQEGAPVVLDNATGLTWQGCPVGMTGNESSCSGDAAMYAWSDAVNHCASLNAGNYAGYSTGWGLPGVKELRGIVDNRHASPEDDKTVFPNTVEGMYWTSASYAPNPLSSWVVYFGSGVFGHGFLIYSIKLDSTYFRCVRRSP